MSVAPQSYLSELKSFLHYNMSSTSATNAGVTFPPSCNRARPYLLLFSLYAMGAGTLLVARPAVVLDFPLLKSIERLTGLVCGFSSASG